MGMEHSAELQKVQKWEKEFKCSFTKEINKFFMNVFVILCCPISYLFYISF